MNFDKGLHTDFRGQGVERVLFDFIKTASFNKNVYADESMYVKLKSVIPKCNVIKLEDATDIVNAMVVLTCDTLEEVRDKHKEYGDKAIVWTLYIPGLRTKGHDKYILHDNVPYQIVHCNAEHMIGITTYGG